MLRGKEYEEVREIDLTHIGDGLKISRTQLLSNNVGLATITVFQH
jgi:hypothetical protein